MTGPAAPTLTVRYDGSSRNFAPGNDIVVGRDLRADVRIAHPLISRAHLILRFDRGRWLAIDNGSLNGMFVNGRRVPTIEIGDGTAVNIGNPDGPQLTFGVGRHTGTAWSWFIDIFSIGCVVFCVTGLFLLQMHSAKRPTTWPVVGAGLVIPILLLVFLVHQ